MIYRFGELELDEDLFELRRNGAVVPLQRRAFDVLASLLKNRDRVVSKEELMTSVWNNVAVSKDALPQAMMTVRRAIGDDVDDPTFIHTLRGRGYRFVAPVECSATADALGTLVGRGRQLALVREAARHAAGGTGRVILMTGAPGIGKTRLLDEIARAGDDARVASVRAVAGAPHLWPFSQLLAALPQLEDAPSIEALRAELAAVDGDVGRTFAVYERVRDLFARLAPLHLLIDDIHEADPSTLRLIGLLAQSVRSFGALIVLTQVTPTPPSVAPLLSAIAREAGSTVVPLEPLARAEVAQLLEASLGRAVSEALVDRVFEKTSGSPLFVSQLVHVLRAEDRLRLTEIETSALVGGDSVRDAVASYLVDLPDTVMRVLTFAAVFGRRFRLAPLAAALAITNEEVLAALDAAAGARIVARPRSSSIPRDDYRFTYPLVRDVLYKKMSAHERAQVHAACGRALAQHAGDDLEHAVAGEIAAHFVEAAPGGDVGRAVDWSLRAAALAEQSGAHEAAARYAARGLDALRFAQKDDVDKRARLVAAMRGAR